MAFLENFIDEIADSEFHTGLLAAFKATLKNHYDVWEDGTRLKWVSSFFLFQATEDMLGGAIEEAHSDTSLACFFDQISDIARSTKSMEEFNITKVKELKLTDEHTVVSFLKKRIACSCLDKRYERVKSITKMGLCMNPRCSRGTRVERSTMLFCTPCRRENYCSRACQREAWPKHKHVCARRVGRNKNAVKNDAFYLKQSISFFVGTVLSLYLFSIIGSISSAKSSVNLLASKKREICSLLEQERTIITHGVGINPYARGPNYSANVYNAATDREWDKLSKATQDALDCAWDGTKYFQEEYAHSTSCDYTGISVCGMLKYCRRRMQEEEERGCCTFHLP